MRKQSDLENAYAIIIQTNNPHKNKAARPEVKVIEF